MSPILKVFISGLLTFTITAGAALLAVLADLAPEDPISTKAWLSAIIGGLIAAAKDWRTFTATSPLGGG